MTFILGDEKLLINSKFHYPAEYWDYPLEELDHVLLEMNTDPDMIYVVGKDKRIYETDCRFYEINDLYKQLNQTPKLRKFELAAISVFVKMYIKHGEEVAIEHFEKWKKDVERFNPNIELIRKNYEYILEPFKNRELKKVVFKPDNDFEKLNNIVLSMCDNDKDLANVFIEQFGSYIENSKDTDLKEGLIDDVEQKAYIAFVLAYDLLNEDFENSSCPESDLVFETSNKIAEDFLESEFNVGTKSLYECLSEYIATERYTKFIYDNEECEER